MRLLIFLVSIGIFINRARTASVTTPLECVRQKIEESTGLVRSSIMANVDGIVKEHNPDANMRPFATAIRGIVDDITLASREMSKSRSADDLSVGKRNAGMLLDTKSRSWTERVDESLKNAPYTIEARKTRAASIFAIFVELGYDTFQSIEKEAKACF